VEIKLWDLLSQGEMIPHLVWFIKNQTYLSKRWGNEINNGKAMFWSDVWWVSPLTVLSILSSLSQACKVPMD
jgi:hypothetical protein